MPASMRATALLLDSGTLTYNLVIDVIEVYVPIPGIANFPSVIATRPMLTPPLPTYNVQENATGPSLSTPTGTLLLYPRLSMNNIFLAMTLPYILHSLF
jgi:hypothetical protein